MKRIPQDETPYANWNWKSPQKDGNTCVNNNMRYISNIAYAYLLVIIYIYKC